MKKIWVNIIEAVFPGTYDEYLESKEIHKVEIKKYRRNPQYVMGMLLFLGPLLYLITTFDSYVEKAVVLSIAIGEMLIRDTVSEHYCRLINKERKPKHRAEGADEPLAL